MPENPDVAELVDRAIPAWIDRFTAEQGHPPSPREVGEIAFRVLIEGSAPDVMATSARPSAYTRDEVLDICEALAAVRQDAGGEMQLKFLALWCYQLLIEGKRYNDVVLDAAGVA